MKKPKKQHYVPQFLLRNFGIARNAKPQIWVLDKKTANIYQTSVRDAAHENQFYSYNRDGINIELENLMQKVDSKGAEIINRIIQNNRLPNSTEERTWLSYYVASQMLRTPVTRNDMENIRKIIIEKFGNDIRCGDDSKPISAYNSEDTKASSLRMLIRDVPTFAEELNNKCWHLCQAQEAMPFIISDNPVVRHNMVDFTPLGNLGLKNDYIELYMPLTSSLSIHIMCNKLAKAVLVTPRLSATYSQSIANGTPISFALENIQFVNSLQVVWAERFVYANERKHLEMPLDMLRTNPELKNGTGVRHGFD